MTRVTTAHADIERTTVATGLAYADLVRAFEGELQRLDTAVAKRLVERQAPWSEVEREIDPVGGPHGLMILAQVEQGPLVSLSGRAIRCSLYLVGNPLIAAQILAVDVRASLYVPFRVTLYDGGGPNGASISFDRPSSFLATLERPELAAFGILLDQKIDAIVANITSPSRSIVIEGREPES
jgi:hypothetical protein